MTVTKSQRVGPKMRVNVEYECNGCQYLKVDGASDSELKYHACHHPSVIEEYSCPQWLTGGYEELELYHIARTPTWLCPYIEKPN
jgi:hypothetical protein